MSSKKYKEAKENIFSMDKDDLISFYIGIGGDKKTIASLNYQKAFKLYCKKYKILDKGTRLEKDFQSEMPKSVEYLEEKINKKIKYWKDQDNKYSSMYYDFEIRFFNKNLYCFELKICKTEKFFFKTMFSNGREKEIYELIRQENFGFRGWVIINHYIKNKINTSYAITPKECLKLFNKGGSLFVTDFDFIEIKRIKNNYNEFIWDLSVLI